MVGRTNPTPFSALVLAAVLFGTGCWQARRGPEPPDLADQYSEVEQTVEKLQAIEASMDAEIDQLQLATDQFFAEDEARWKRPFPLDAFKHTAMSCLNAPYDQSEPAPQVREVADRFGISCAVAAATDLDQSIPASIDRKAVIAKLREIDAIRSVRARLQGRLRQLPSITRRTRNYLVARRAEARQMEKEIRRRQTEYSRKNFRDALDRVEGYHRRLETLEGQIEVIEQSLGRWSRELGNVVDALYKRLSRLGTS